MRLFANSGVTSVAGDTLFAVLFILGVLAVLFTAVWLLIRFAGRVSDGKSFAALAGMLIGIGVVLRLILTFTIKGYREDLSELYDAMDGMTGYYLSGGTLSPLTAALYRVIGLLCNGFGLGIDSVWLQFFAKLPILLADCGTAVVLYLLAKRYLGGYAGVIIAGLFSLCPAFLFASVWGSVYSIMTFGMVLSAWFLIRRQYLGLCVAFALTMLTGREALFLVPVVAVFVVTAFVRGCIALKKVKAENGIMSSPETAVVVKLPVYVVLSVLLAYLVSLPAVMPDYGAGFFTWIYQVFLLPLVTVTFFGYNALGIFNLFGKNGDLLGTGFPATVFAVIFGVLVVGIVLLVYLSRKNRANLVFTAAYVLLTLATYFVDFTAMSLLPVLVLLLFAFIVVRDKRILRILTVLAFAFTVNATGVMLSAGYLSNAADAAFAAGTAYAGSTLLTGVGFTTLSIVCSVLTVLAHLYCTLVILDIALSDKRSLLENEPMAGMKHAFRWFVK